MKSKITGVLCATILALVLPLPVQAAPVQWFLDGVTFEDGAIATGSFFFDADQVPGPGAPSAFTQPLITVSGPGTIYPTLTNFNFLNPNLLSNPFFFSFASAASPMGTFPDPTMGDLILNVELSDSLNSPGTIPITIGSFSEQAFCLGVQCLQNTFRNSITGGSVTTDPVPTPSAFLLMGTGLVGLIGWRWWSTKNA